VPNSVTMSAIGHRSRQYDHLVGVMRPFFDPRGLPPDDPPRVRLDGTEDDLRRGSGLRLIGLLLVIPAVRVSSREEQTDLLSRIRRTLQSTS